MVYFAPGYKGQTQDGRQNLPYPQMDFYGDFLSDKFLYFRGCADQVLRTFEGPVNYFLRRLQSQYSLRTPDLKSISGIIVSLQ